jgi:hypothetical protein
MRLPRMSIRRWMVAVAVVATLLFTLVNGARMHRKRSFCLRQAAAAALTEANWKAEQERYASLIASVERQRKADGPTEVLEKVARTLRAELSSMTPKAEYYARARQHWEHAAVHPWLPIKPSPPAPD